MAFIACMCPELSPGQHTACLGEGVFLHGQRVLLGCLVFPEL